MPISSAGRYTKGLKEEPGWRSAWVVRLNWLFSKDQPPAMASTRPVAGSGGHPAPSTAGVAAPALRSPPHTVAGREHARHALRRAAEPAFAERAAGPAQIVQVQGAAAG